MGGQQGEDFRSVRGELLCWAGGCDGQFTLSDPPGAFAIEPFFAGIRSGLLFQIVGRGDAVLFAEGHRKMDEKWDRAKSTP